MRRFYLVVLLAVATCFGASAKDLIELLNSIDRVSDVQKIDVNGFNESYSFNFEQPIDHKDLTKGSFKQRVILEHNNFYAPVVAVLEGYMIWGTYKSEPCQILDANQIIIEHRFFAESIPADSIIPWENLTILNAATDQHDIIQALKKNIYGHSKWLTTGISKGGQTTIFHRFFYPDDVDVSVPYVAPLNLDFVDPRLQKNIERLGSERNSLTKVLVGNGDSSPKYLINDFQTYCFQHFDEILPIFTSYADSMHYTYKAVGSVERALQLIILEYPFSFWQSGATVSNIPHADIDVPQDFFNHLIDVSDANFLEDSEIAKFRPFYYQALTEIGFYDYKIGPFKKYLPNESKDITFEFCLDEAASKAASKVVYNRDKMRNIAKWLQNDAVNMIFIYGESDAWSGTQVDLKDNKNCWKFVCKDMPHSASIANFDPVTKEFITNKLLKLMQ